MDAVTTDDHPSILRLRAQILDLMDLALAAERAVDLSRIHPDHRSGAANLLHYRALRALDLRALQAELSRHGLSSLGRMEPRVMENLAAVAAILSRAAGQPVPEICRPFPTGEPETDELQRNADALFSASSGVTASHPGTRIMVTLPSEAATDPTLVRDIVQAGGDVVRINCAHDGPDAWRAMARNARSADPRTAVSMDLGGPKLRTGPITPGPHVLKVKPRRDPLGRVVEPGMLWLVGETDTATDLQSAPVTDAETLDLLTVGQDITFHDTRGRRRIARVVRTESRRVLIAADRTYYLTPGARLSCSGDDGRRIRLTIGELPSSGQYFLVRAGQRIVVTADDTPVNPDDPSTDLTTIGCTLPEVFSAVAPGHRILFDDGKIEGIIESVSAGGGGADSLVARITRAGLDGAKLRGGKGINLPDSSLPVPALTDDDRKDLETVVEIADMTALSFVRSAGDVAELLDTLADAADTGTHRGTDLGVVVKIETVEGFTALPEILLELMRHRRIGVMIARGDLAVEAGFERLVEVQEEILWLCEAGHVPTIWATQVLDSMAGNGLPTRSEITDAGAARRAECAMLNKGPNIVAAIGALDAVLDRMGSHLDKKSPVLRRLSAWTTPGEGPAATATGSEIEDEAVPTRP
ncbi:pyruvate kinase [Gordonia desulfuricans]|uniref:pyruvate kinase n=1 Tax=Gordonia desulfuricans TaxID=89051 RepID=A0A7K3LJG9_9ACTN|nr:pyruvate kinase [Gordonia desulfuricans]NDK88211.1 pyruvate kinase [Gordonia desulfuricans]